MHHDEGAQDLGFTIGTLPIEQRTVVLQGGKVTKTTYCTVLTGLNEVHSSLIGATEMNPSQHLALLQIKHYPCRKTTNKQSQHAHRTHQCTKI